ncbi:MAG: DNA primase, partial [Tannerella sp.]|nr:DNA primase [Tannerella sp.]
SFNLNTGTDAAFFMILERLRNIVVVMEEYNDNTISAVKFQGIKSATLDGEGKIKVKDVASKTMDSSKINAIPLLLGQEAAQQDDGALSNRCILCEVPYKPKGEFTEEETALFEKLKAHERTGLCNVFIEILKLRPLIKKHFLNMLPEETKKLKEAIKLNVVNTEGLTRILNAVALMTSICRFMEEHVPQLKLPFGYEEFFQIACAKVLKQMEMISSSNKLATYFNTISFLLNQGTLKIGRELKVIAPGRITRLVSGHVTEDITLTPPETKVLFLNYETIYNAYQKSIGDKDALSRSSLRSYFASNQSYLGFCRSTLFKWQVVKQVPRSPIDRGYEDNAMRQVVEWEKNNTSAYMFNYDKLKDLMNIDFERSDMPEATEEPASGKLKEVKITGDLPF